VVGSIAALPGSAVAGTSGGWSFLGKGAAAGSAAIADKVDVVERSGTELHVGGQFVNAGGIAAADRIAVWNGSAWSAVGAGIGNGTVFAIAVDPVTRDVYAGGSFSDAGSDLHADGIARWDGSHWSSLDSVSLNANVTALEVVGRALDVGGAFSNAAGLAPADAIAAWDLDGGGWSAITDSDLAVGGTVSDIEADGAGHFWARAPMARTAPRRTFGTSPPSAAGCTSAG